MAPIAIVHSTTKADFLGSGAVAPNQELIAQDWNAVHATLSAGAGFSIVSDGGTPPTLTFAVTSTQPTATTFGGSLIPTIDNAFDIGSTLFRWRNYFGAGTVSAGSGFQTNVASTLGSLNITTPYGTTGAIKFTQDFVGGIGFSVVANGTAIQLDGSPDLRSSNDLSSDLGSDLKRFQALHAPIWRNTGGTGLTLQVGSYSIIANDALPGSITVDSIGHANLVDFGTSSLTYRSIYFGTTLSGGAIVVGGNQTVNGSINVSTVVSVGVAGASIAHTSTGIVGGGQAVNISPASGFNTIFTAGHIQPQSDAIADVGLATTRWRNGYFTGTLSAGGGFQTNVGSSLSHLMPSVDAAYDIGGPFGTPNTNNRWRNGVFSSSITVGLPSSDSRIGNAGVVIATGLVSAGSSGFQTNSTSIIATGYTTIQKQGTNGINITPKADASEVFSLSDSAGLIYVDWSTNASLPRLELARAANFTIFSDNFVSTKFSILGTSGLINSGLAFTSVGSTIIPNNDNLYDLGINTVVNVNRWRNANFSGVVSVGTIAGANYALSIGFQNTMGTGTSVLAGLPIQVTLGGTFNSGYNSSATSATAKLWIGNYDNDGPLVYVVYAEDENNTVDWWIRNRPSVGELPVMFFAGALSVGGASFFTSTVSSGTGFQTNNSNLIVTANGVAIGYSSSANVLFTNAVWAPGSDNSLDLGATSLKWRNSYFAGTVSVGTGNAAFLQSSGTNFIINAGGLTDIRLIPGAGGAVNFNNAAASNIFGILPSATNTNDLGSAALQWRNVFFATADSFGGTTGAGKGWTTNTSAGIQFGGAATSTGVVSGTARVIPIMINGAIWYLQAFPIAV